MNDVSIPTVGIPTARIHGTQQGQSSSVAVDKLILTEDQAVICQEDNEPISRENNN